MVTPWSRSGASAVRLFVGLLALTIALLYSGSAPERVRYDGMAAVRAHPRTIADLERVLAVSADVWSEYPAVGDVEVVADEDGLAELAAAGIAFDVLLPDIQAPVDAERARLQSVGPAKPSNWFTEYRDYEAVGNYIERLVDEHPDLASQMVVGRSVEGREIRAMRIAGFGSVRKPVMINGGQHAREWIGVMVPMCIADRLLRRYGSDDGVREFVDGTELFVVPLVNPDGYVYAWENDRYWRKNRGGRHGVDLNRNYAVGFGGRGSSSNPRSQVYRGPHAFSEPESKAVRDVLAMRPFVAHIDFHSFGQLVLYPWSYKREATPHRGRFAALGDRMASAIYAAHSKTYKLQAGADLYAAGGTLMDYGYGERGALSFTIELRPKGGGGFVLPPEQIIPTCDESLAALLELRFRLG